MELETHFKLARTKDKCFLANQLYLVYSNPIRQSYLLFIRRHLEAVQKVNKMFQGASETDMSKLLDTMCMLIESTANVVTGHRDGFDALNSDIADFLTVNPNLGYEFERFVKDGVDAKLFTAASVDAVRNRSFICELASRSFASWWPRCEVVFPRTYEFCDKSTRYP